jgi:glycine/D-amino acid oxidase-like deaminating enzyme
MHHLYEPEAYDATQWPDSYWAASAPPLPNCPKLMGSAVADVAIIGAGYTGLNAGLELAEAFGADVMVLDAGQPGWGASGRNGGFACLGGAKLSDAQISRRFGTEAAAEFAAYQLAAIARVDDNLTRYGIDADKGPQGELFLAHSARAWARLQSGPKLPGARLLTPEALREMGNTAAGIHGAMHTPHGFPIHPLKYARGLTVAARAAGVRVMGDSRVVRAEPTSGGWALHTTDGILRAKRVLIATNGYTDERLPDWLHRRILPAFSSILVTEPIPLEVQVAQGWTNQTMAYDSRHLLHYFRLLSDGRLMFGARGGVSARPEAQARFAARTRAELNLLLPEFATIKTAHAWSGLVCLTPSGTPFLGAIPGTKGLFAALGWHGNGVAAASEGGRRIASTLMAASDTIPVVMKSQPSRLPIPRKLALRIGMIGARLLDGRLK